MVWWWELHQALHQCPRILRLHLVMQMLNPFSKRCSIFRYLPPQRISGKAVPGCQKHRDAFFLGSKNHGWEDVQNITGFINPELLIAGLATLAETHEFVIWGPWRSQSQGAKWNLNKRKKSWTFGWWDMECFKKGILVSNEILQWWCKWKYRVKVTNRTPVHKTNRVRLMFIWIQNIKIGIL